MNHRKGNKKKNNEWLKPIVLNREHFNEKLGEYEGEDTLKQRTEAGISCYQPWNRVYLFGGVHQTTRDRTHHSSILILDFTEEKPSPSTEVKYGSDLFPPDDDILKRRVAARILNRRNCGFVAVNNGFVSKVTCAVFGGIQDGTLFGDLVTIDLDRFIGSKSHDHEKSKPIETIPSARSQHKVVVAQRKMWLFGGMGMKSSEGGGGGVGEILPLNALNSAEMPSESSEQVKGRNPNLN